MKASENQIERSIWEYLTAKGYFCFKHKDQAKRIAGRYRKCPMQINGVPDLAVFVEGRVIYLEVKTTTGVQSAEQIDFQETCKKHNIPYYVVTNAKQALKIVVAIDSGRSTSDPKTL